MDWSTSDQENPKTRMWPKGPGDTPIRYWRPPWKTSGHPRVKVMISNIMLDRGTTCPRTSSLCELITKWLTSIRHQFPLLRLSSKTLERGNPMSTGQNKKPIISICSASGAPMCPMGRWRRLPKRRRIMSRRTSLGPTLNNIGKPSSTFWGCSSIG